MFNPDNSPRGRGYYPHFANQQTEAQRKSLTCPQVTSTPSCQPRRTLGPKTRSRVEIKGNGSQPAWVCLGQGPSALGQLLWASISTMCTGGHASHLTHVAAVTQLCAWADSAGGWLFFQPSYGISPVPGRDNQVPHHPYLAPKAGISFGNKSERGLCNGAFVQLLLLLKAGGPLKTQNSQVGMDGQMWGAIVCADSPGQLLFF